MARSANRLCQGNRTLSRPTPSRLSCSYFFWAETDLQDSPLCDGKFCLFVTNP